MAFRILWAPEALEDLYALTAYIAQDNPAAAERLGSAILTKVRLLEQHPFLGKKMRELVDPSMREISQLAYRIIYSVNEREHVIEIIRIWHVARDEPELQHH